jgi:hypothetical protein
VGGHEQRIGDTTDLKEMRDPKPTPTGFTACSRNDPPTQRQRAGTRRPAQRFKRDFFRPLRNRSSVRDSMKIAVRKSSGRFSGRRRAANGLHAGNGRLTSEVIWAARRRGRRMSKVELEPEYERALERHGLEVFYAGLRESLDLLPSGCVSKLALAPLLSDVEFRLEELARPAPRSRRVCGRPRRHAQ